MPVSVKSHRLEFPGISPAAFEHPLDRTALQALRKTPGLDLLLKKLSALHIERILRLRFTSSSLRLTSRQLPHIYDLLRDSCAVLDAPEPDFYLHQDPIPNAFAFGMQRHTIVVTSGLVDLLDTDELRGVVGHELGHIKSGHMLYHTMAVFIAIVAKVAARNLPFVNLISQALLIAFYDWLRKSELTADRAGLLVSQDSDVAVRTLLKLAGGTITTVEPVSVEEFLKQADEFEDMGANLIDAIYAVDMILYQTHPFPALRAREIKAWHESDQFASIVRGDYEQVHGSEFGRRCPHCAAPVNSPTFRFCPDCGKEL